MASSVAVEEESGRYVSRPRHPHNGYYAGDWSATLEQPTENRTS